LFEPKKKISKMPRHTWTKDDIRLVFSTCRANPENIVRVRILQSYFPECSKHALNLAIRRYQHRNDEALYWDPVNGGPGWATNGLKWAAVWLERDWRMIVE